MAITKIQSESLNLADTYDFTGTVTGAGGVNTPAFRAYLGSNQNISNATNTKIQIEVEDFDTDSAYDTTTYKFQPQTAGKYCVNVSVLTDTDEAGATSIDGLDVYIYKNCYIN